MCTANRFSHDHTSGARSMPGPGIYDQPGGIGWHEDSRKPNAASSILGTSTRDQQILHVSALSWRAMPSALLGLLS